MSDSEHASACGAEDAVAVPLCASVKYDDVIAVPGNRDRVAECTRRGGVKNGLKDIWMVHDWVAPGWDCSWGVFAAECPELGGTIGGGPFTKG